MRVHGRVRIKAAPAARARTHSPGVKSTSSAGVGSSAMRRRASFSSMPRSAGAGGLQGGSRGCATCACLTCSRVQAACHAVAAQHPPAWQVRLHPPPPGPTAIVLLHERDRRRVALQAAAKGLGDRLVRHVVVRGADACVKERVYGRGRDGAGAAGRAAVAAAGCWRRTRLSPLRAQGLPCRSARVRAPPLEKTKPSSPTRARRRLTVS